MGVPPKNVSTGNMMITFGFGDTLFYLIVGQNYVCSWGFGYIRARLAAIGAGNVQHQNAWFQKHNESWTLLNSPKSTTSLSSFGRKKHFVTLCPKFYTRCLLLTCCALYDLIWLWPAAYRGLPNASHSYFPSFGPLPCSHPHESFVMSYVRFAPVFLPQKCNAGVHHHPFMVHMALVPGNYGSTPQKEQSNGQNSPWKCHDCGYNPCHGT